MINFIVVTHGEFGAYLVEAAEGIVGRQTQGVRVVATSSRQSVAEIKRINAAGGSLDGAASGVSEEELVRAIGLGISKVNIGTDGRLIWTRVHREFFRERPGEFDFMPPGRTYMDAYADFVAAKCETLGAARRAGSPATASLPPVERTAA